MRRIVLTILIMAGLVGSAIVVEARIPASATTSEGATSSETPDTFRLEIGSLPC